MRKQGSSSNQTTLRKQLLTELRAGKKGVASWNARSDEQRRSVGSFRVKLCDKQLDGINFKRLDFQETNFEGASLVGANLRVGSFQGANFMYANLYKADLAYADLCGADFSVANLQGACLDMAKYDAFTRWPTSFRPSPRMCYVSHTGNVYPVWSPSKRRQAAEKVPLDRATFLSRLRRETDTPRLNKALDMLKTERFQLYADVENEGLRGVIRSQTDSNLVYSCRLDQTGGFGCCSQNLHPCGGLRGRPCKHLLVLILGLTQSGSLSYERAYAWLTKTELKTPKLDKDSMAGTFLQYKGAEAGTVDWRPTETIPEDFYAW